MDNSARLVLEFLRPGLEKHQLLPRVPDHKLAAAKKANLHLRDLLKVRRLSAQVLQRSSFS